jgi:YggT family protein
MGVAFLRNLVGLVLLLLWLLVVARVVVSWVDPRGRNAFSRTIIDWSEPILGPVRRLLPPFGSLDVSPLVVAVALGVLLRLVGV